MTISHENTATIVMASPETIIEITVDRQTLAANMRQFQENPHPDLYPDVAAALASLDEKSEIKTVFNIEDKYPKPPAVSSHPGLTHNLMFQSTVFPLRFS